jgi:hypothetical protein
MKRIQVNGKDYILITSKQLEIMLGWFGMASNCGDNDITKSDVSLRNSILSILNEIETK